MKQLMTGNEAVARGAWEAGMHFASAYPGTPSTEILENIANYQEIISEWAPNEKVALEAAIGASFAGGRSMAAMKHVGLNVAADAFVNSAMTGTHGGLVVLVADDPLGWMWGIGPVLIATVLLAWPEPRPRPAAPADSE